MASFVKSVISLFCCVVLFSRIEAQDVIQQRFKSSIRMSFQKTLELYSTSRTKMPCARMCLEKGEAICSSYSTSTLADGNTLCSFFNKNIIPLPDSSPDVNLLKRAPYKIYTMSQSTCNYYMVADVSSMSNLRFDVKACNDAHIFITSTSLIPQTYDDLYQFVFGAWSNSKSFLRIQLRFDNYGVTPVHQGAIMNCNQMQSYWVAWGDGNMGAGTGTVVGSQAIYTYTHTTPHVANYAFICSGWGATGDWIIHV